MMTSQKSKIFGKFLGFFRVFYQNFHRNPKFLGFFRVFNQNFPQNFQIQDKNSQVNLKLNQIVSGLLQGKDD